MIGHQRLQGRVVPAKVKAAIGDLRLISAAVATVIVALVVSASTARVALPSADVAAVTTPIPALTPLPVVAPLASPTATPDPWAETAERCGSGRWAVRTLGDPDVTRIDFRTEVSATVADLAAIRRPLVQLPKEGRVGPLETTLFAVDARLLEARVTAADELQVAIGDPKSSATLVVTMPADSCLARTQTALRSQITTVRNGFVTTCGPFDADWRAVGGSADIVAAGYWSFVDPTGPATNGLQLSAPIAFQVHGGCAPGGASPSAAASVSAN